MDGIPTIVHLSSLPQSIRYRALFEPSGRQTIFEWCIDRLQSYAPSRLVILARPAEAERVAPLIAHRDVELVMSKHQADAEALREVVNASGWDQLACVVVEHAFAPKTLLKEMGRYHVDGGYAATLAHGVPMAVRPLFLNMSALRSVWDRVVPLWLGNPWHLCELLAKLPNRDGTATRFDIGRYDVAERHAIPSNEIPYSLAVRTPADVALARQVISKAHLEGDGAGLLATWRRAVIAMRRAQRHEQIRSLAVGKHDRTESVRRVLFVSNGSAYSGGEESLCQLAAHLDRTRYTGAALVAYEGQFSTRLADATDRVFCPNEDLNVGTVDMYDYIRTVVSEYRPEVIHCNGRNGSAVLFIARAAHLPIVQHVRVADLAGWEEDLNAASAVVAVSEYIRAKVLVHDIPPEDVHVVYNGVDLSRFYPGAVDGRWARTQLDLDQRTFTLVMIARFAANKGHDRLVEAVGALVRRGCQLQVICVGESMPGELGLARIENHIKALHLSNHVRLIGFQEDTRVPLAAADALVLCSDQEPFARCVLEAMAMGVPVIVTEAGGLAEVLAPRHAGLLVPQGNIAALSEAIATLVADHEKRLALRAAGIETVTACLTSRQYADAMLDVFDGVLTAPARQM